MMVVPSRRGGDRFPTVDTPPTLALPQEEQTLASPEGSRHLRGEALLEVQSPPGIVGIGPVRKFGMARDGETVRFEELDGSALSRCPLYFPCKHPVVGANGGKVASFDPADAFMGMPSFGPAPQRLEDRMVDRLKDLGADNMPVILCPPSNEGVEQTDQRT